ncbi:unnamed protein product [Dracunculus medinensis]|uniref:PX domain-containing protein n=1 Tax=Dracunculus medinensis TaxID=318479 RepID=A0A0N4UJY3_DRAME|nr:unnamed protein product [Dracunculus medinensis]
MWLLYSRYIHSGAEERITLPEMVADEFQKAVESRQLELLDSSIEIAYQIVYTRLQCDFVVPFCQSDCFFGYLCGSPPITVDELINEEKLNEEKRLILPSAEPAFSLSQFRMRLWKIVMPSTSEASIDLSFDRLSDIDAYDSLPNDKAEIATEAVGDKNSDYSQLLNFDMNFKSGCEIENEIVDGTSCASCKGVELAERQPDCCAPYEFSIFDAQRDINRWMITIPHIQPRRDNGRLSYVYTVCVERFDLNGNAFGSENCCFNNSLNKNIAAFFCAKFLLQWSVTRRYNEFYVLESKLLEFHGDLIRSDPLPIRRPFSAKNRIFIEMQRPIFERFIQLLTRQSALKKSDLLYTFLTSDQELKDNIQLSDLNPWNMVRKVPSKFTRERGQNLKPFILSLMAKALAPQSEIADSAFESLLSRGEKSETRLEHLLIYYECVSKPRKFLLSTIFGDNCPTSVIDLTTSGQYVFWTRSFTDSLAFLLDHLFLVPHWFASLLLSSQVLFGSAIDNMISTFLKRVLTTAFLESNCIHLIRFIQDSLFSGDSVTSTNQEKALRAELAQRLILEYLQEEIPSNLLKAIGHKEFRRGVIAILSALQYPRLNKQLSYVFLDILVAKLFHITCN